MEYGEGDLGGETRGDRGAKGTTPFKARAAGFLDLSPNEKGLDDFCLSPDDRFSGFARPNQLDEEVVDMVVMQLRWCTVVVESKSSLDNGCRCSEQRSEQDQRVRSSNTTCSSECCVHAGLLQKALTTYSQTALETTIHNGCALYTHLE